MSVTSNGANSAQPTTEAQAVISTEAQAVASPSQAKRIEDRFNVEAMINYEIKNILIELEKGELDPKEAVKDAATLGFYLALEEFQQQIAAYFFTPEHPSFPAKYRTEPVEWQDNQRTL